MKSKYLTPEANRAVSYAVRVAMQKAAAQAKKMLLRTVSLPNQEPKVVYIHDGTGSGHDHNAVRITYNNGSYDNRIKPTLFCLDWSMEINNKGICLPLVNVEMDSADENIRYKYWRQERGTNWVPLHDLVDRETMRLHFNKAITFTQDKLKQVTASVPVNIINDIGGAWDVFKC